MDEECEHDYEYTEVVYMGSEYGRMAWVCSECGEEDDSEPYHAD